MEKGSFKINPYKSFKLHIDDNRKFPCAKIGTGGLDAEPKQRVRSKPFVNQYTGTYQERCLFSVTGAHLHPPLSDVHRTSFTFTGKERDEETGYSSFSFSPLDVTSFVIPLGTLSKVHRTFFTCYMDADLLTGWLSVNPMADKYPSLSPYNYCAWNPVKLVDPNGEEMDWVRDNETNCPVWMDNVKSAEETPEGYTYLGNTFSYRIGEEGHGLTVLGDEQGNMQSILDPVEIVANHNEMSKYNESPWLDIGLSEVGVKEESDNWSPRIAEYLASCGLYKKAPWCAAYVNFCLVKAGYKGGGAVGRRYKTDPNFELLKTPKRGAIAIFKTGHLAIYKNTTPEGRYELVHGNWSSQVSHTYYTKPSEIDCFVFPKKKKQ